MLTPESIIFFKDLETSLHKKEVRNSHEKVDALIADDFMEFGKSGGVYFKNDTLAGLASEQVDLAIEVSDFLVKELGDSAVLVTYKATMLDSDNVTKVTTLRSSIWQKQNENRRMMFHQGTKGKEYFLFEHRPKLPTRAQRVSPDLDSNEGWVAAGATGPLLIGSY